MRSRLALLLLVGVCLAASARAESAPRPAPSSAPAVPDELLVDQDGRTVHLERDLLAGHPVFVNFVYTTCSTICSPMTANFARLQEKLRAAGRTDARLVSITLDPDTDTPAKLTKYAEAFHRGPGWTFVTGATPAVTRVSKALGGYAADRTSHPAVTLVGFFPGGPVRRVNGVVTADTLLESLAQVEAERGPAPAGDLESASRRYFTDTPLVDQTGRTRRLFTDVIAGHTVLISFGFTSCKGVCPTITRNLVEVRRRLEAAGRKDVRFITLSVDPLTDTPPVMAAFAERHGVFGDWVFLTGTGPDMDTILRKLGGFTPDPEKHTPVVSIGDARTGVWLKAMAMDAPDLLADAILNLNADPP